MAASLAEPIFFGNFPPKHVSDNLDYTFDFTDRLIAGESIVSVVFTIPAPLVKGTEIIDSGGKKVAVWLSVGGANVNHKLLAAVTTNSTPDARIIIGAANLFCQS